MLDSLVRWLRTLGKTGELAAAAITLLESKTGLALIGSAILGALTWVWAGLFEVLSNPHAQIAVGAFLVTLWTYIALRLLWTVRQPIHAVPVPDYRYCLNPENFQLGVNMEEPDAALQV